ncbi:MAG: preprotein translocase subunit SecY [Ruminococcus sp.]|nr:preprotein translocase subunit SecY [Ruminococcus sp.]MCM1381171.1 preprotein translocase subunit SecY [Muribaculaceae bacterium]MCM1478201.1 preprotein translocase subunit SecY [Muribaculaceae bacterium]
MFSTFRNAWKVPELRKKILYTLLIILVFRIGCHVPVPFMDPDAVSSMFAEGNFLSYMNLLSGGALSQGTLFALSIQPYINASIIVQLLTYALPPLENLQKEGESGRKKLQKITSLVALLISLVMSYAYFITLRNQGALTYTSGFPGVFTGITIVLAFTAGASIVVWLGNRINENGIGNGISMILFAGIVSRGPGAIQNMFEQIKADTKYVFVVPAVLIVFVLMIGFIVFMNESERRIPIQYAKRVVGRKQYGGQSTHIPIKIAMSGVMPIIFAMAIMSLPSTLSMFIKPAAVPETFWQKFYAGFLHFFSYTSPWYAILYFLLIIAFNYFYVSMQYNPIEIANGLRQNNGGIPGIRPGKPTSDFIKRVLGKITLVGAFFLGVIAIFPILTNLAFPDLGIAMGGTSILIIVSVVLETVRTLESQMMMRHHKGFLE